MTHHQLHAPLSPELGARALDVIVRLRSGRLVPAQADIVADLICDMTDSSLRHFFVRPAEAFRLGLASRGVIDLGVRSTVKTIRVALRQILPKLDAGQFRQLADYLEEAVEPAHAPRHGS